MGRPIMSRKTVNSIAELISFRRKQIESIDWNKLDIAAFSLQQTNINGRECPHCGSHHVVSKGNYKKRKRYQCRGCGKSYNDLTNTPFSGIHDLEKIKKYLICMIEGCSIRKAARICGISVPTSFDWRHRLLDIFKSLPSPRLKNVLELAEIQMDYSHKGQRTKLTQKLRDTKISIVMTSDRNGLMDSDVIALEHRQQNPIFHRIARITDSHTDLIASPQFLNDYDFTSEINIKSQNSPYSSPKTIHLITTAFQQWMKRFHGVATKYLSNYLHWFDLLDNIIFSNNHNTDSTRSLICILLRNQLPTLS
jgi:transposase-like protein